MSTHSKPSAPTGGAEQNDAAEQWAANIEACPTCKGTRRKSCDAPHNSPEVVARHAECPWCADLFADGKSEGCEEHYPPGTSAGVATEGARIVRADEVEVGQHVYVGPIYGVMLVKRLGIRSDGFVVISMEAGGLPYYRAEIKPGARMVVVAPSATKGQA